MQHTPEDAQAVASIASMVATAPHEEWSRAVQLAERMLDALNAPRTARVTATITADQARELSGLRAGGHA